MIRYSAIRRAFLEALANCLSLRAAVNATESIARVKFLEQLVLDLCDRAELGTLDEAFIRTARHVGHEHMRKEAQANGGVIVRYPSNLKYLDGIE